MDPIKAQALVELAPVIAIITVVAVAGWVFTTWLRVKNGYPLENSWGLPIHRSNLPEGDKRLLALAEENRHLRTELGELKNRIAVIERIVTDPAARVDREIAALRSDHIN